jgi:hypothetical protein
VFFFQFGQKFTYEQSAVASSNWPPLAEGSIDAEGVSSRLIVIQGQTVDEIAGVQLWNEHGVNAGGQASTRGMAWPDDQGQNLQSQLKDSTFLANSRRCNDACQISMVRSRGDKRRDVTKAQSVHYASAKTIVPGQLTQTRFNKPSSRSIFGYFRDHRTRDSSETRTEECARCAHTRRNE